MQKLQIAQRQLETAIGLFITRKDRISAITLAGAADGILHGLVLKAGKQPFSDYALGIAETMKGETPPKVKYSKHINDTLKINSLKHMDENESEDVTLDVDISALGAILKAIANHHALFPEHPGFIHAMLQWTYMFYDGEKITEDVPFVEPAGKLIIKKYENRPKEIVEKEKKMAKKLQEAIKEK